MFDKLYKEANDEIPVNTVLMEQLKAEASRSRKKSYSGFVYRYGYAAAAIVLVAVSASVLPKMTEKPSVNSPIPAVIRSAEKEDAAQTEQDIEYTSKAVEKSAEKVTPARAAETKNQASTIPENLTKQAEVEVTQDIGSDQTVTSSMVETQVQEDAKSSRMIADEPMTAMYSHDEELTFPEYMERFGFTYSEEELPEGLVLTGGSTVYQEGEEGGSLYGLQYQGESKSLSITFYPESEPVQEIIDSMGKSAETCVFDKNSEDECKAYLIKEDKGFIIESEGIEMVELEEFVNSIG